MGLEALLGPRVVETVATASPSEGEPNTLAIDRVMSRGALLSADSIRKAW